MKSRIVKIHGYIPKAALKAVAWGINQWHEACEAGSSFYRVMLGWDWEKYNYSARDRRSK